jgi:hypothetical protein
MMTRHRGTCEAPGCGRIWRENCVDCLTEVTDRHRTETGHAVGLAITPDDVPMWKIRDQVIQARLVLLRPKQGW